MTSTSMNYKPFLLSPCGKDYIWGGNRLQTEFNKDIPLDVLAETWECSTHPDGPCVVAAGEFAGQTLQDVLRAHPEYLGTHPADFGNGDGELPVLIKLIDAKKDLSVQVHPSDEYAFEKENGQLGKTEMWYVCDAREDASLVYGFEQDMTKETLRQSLMQGNIQDYLQKIPVKKNDVFFIQAGTVHAIGAGALIAEVQESSNLTYRLYDYDRVDKTGKKRELHIDKAMDVVHLESSKAPRQPMKVLRYANGMAQEMLCRCQYFQTWRYLLDTEKTRQMARFQTQHNSFSVLLCLDGCGVCFIEGEEPINFIKGDCLFVPADSVPLRLHGKAQLLAVNC